MADSLRMRFTREMITRGLAESTRAAYLQSVELMVRRTGKDPRHMARDDLRDYFASLVEAHHAAPVGARSQDLGRTGRRTVT